MFVKLLPEFGFLARPGTRPFVAGESRHSGDDRDLAFLPNYWKRKEIPHQSQRRDLRGGSPRPPCDIGKGQQRHRVHNRDGAERAFGRAQREVDKKEADYADANQQSCGFSRLRINRCEQRHDRDRKEQRAAMDQEHSSRAGWRHPVERLGQIRLEQYGSRRSMDGGKDKPARNDQSVHLPPPPKHAACSHGKGHVRNDVPGQVSPRMIWSTLVCVTGW